MNRWIIRSLLGLVAVGTLGLLAMFGVLAYQAVNLPLPDHVSAPRQVSLSLRAADGTPLANAGAYRGEMIGTEDLPQHIVNAVLAIEDRRFYEHGGIDVLGIMRAGLANLRARGITEGGSTITQQLARIMFLSSERTIRRKIQEAMIALWLERRLSKDQILARYLNSIYFGGGAWGIDGAARRYFAKPAGDLSLPEAAMLAGLIRAPSFYAPTRDMATSRQRAGVVLDAMVEARMLEPKQAAQAKETPVKLAPESPRLPGSGWFADWAGGQAQQMLNPGTPPAVVETTLDPELQRAAEQAVENIMRRDGEKGNASQAALVAMTQDGAVLAMVGGRDYETSQFNRAFQARRQAGSLFKLFVYLAAFQRGYGPNDVLIDQPVRVGAWEPANFENFYRGPVDLRTAFAQSLNSISVQLASDVGWGRVVEVARSMGVTSPLLPVPSLALGAADVTLLEMTGAFAAVAANKARVRPLGVRRVIAGDQVVEMRLADQPPPNWNRSMIVDLLAEVMRSGTAAGSALNRPSAGKTGTSQEFRDAWFVGFTADVVVGVWVGNDDNSPMEHVTGSRLPARIWHDFMVAADQIKVGKGRRRELDLPPMAQQPPSAQYAAVPGAPGVYVTVTEPAEAVGIVRGGGGDLAGVPTVLDPGTLAIGGRVVRLFGVSGDRRFTSQMQRFIAGREAHCRAVGDGGQYRCEVDGHDLSRVVLYNGGGRSTTEVPANLADAERTARSARRGVWGG